MVAAQNHWSQVSREISEAVARVAQSVLAVHGRPRFTSTGFTWDEQTVVTAAHTVIHDQDIRISRADGSSVSAKLIGRDPGTDLAALSVDDPLPLTARRAADALAPGQWTVAVARLPGGRLAASGGIVSEVGPAWRTWRGGLIDRTIRLDGTIAAWFCGAPLLDASGDAVGLCTTGLTRGRAVLIPTTTVERVLRELKDKGHVSRAYIGLAMQRVELSGPVAGKLALQSPNGALIVSVQPDAPGDRAGILVGDILVRLSGKDVRDAGDVQDVLADVTAGADVPAVLIRGGERMEIALSTVERPLSRRAG